MRHNIDSTQHGPLGEPMVDAIQACVHCGFCLAACPTYGELGQEMDTPRGRIVLMKEVLEGELEIEQALPHVDRCLGCLACEPACPSGVVYRDLISPFRALANEKRNRSVAERLRRMLVSQTLPYPWRFRLAARLGNIGKRMMPWVPASFRPMVDLIPDKLPRKMTWPERTPAKGRRRSRVALLAGCAQQVLDPDINTATIDVLVRNGVEVIIPPAQGCCGALSWHVGDLEAARAFAIQNLQTFSQLDVDAIITNAAGCGSGLQEYHLILKGTPWEGRAEVFRNRVMDVTVFLHRLGDLEPFPEGRAPCTIAYQDACHLAHAQGIVAQPRALLRRIPGIKLVDLPDAHLCCGSAGTYNIDQPEIAFALGEKKARAIAESGAEAVASGNIGCLTQLRSHLSRQGFSIPVRHTVQILRDAWDGGE